MTLLADNRLAVCNEKEIMIYSDKSFKLVLNFKTEYEIQFNGCMTGLSNGNLLIVEKCRHLKIYNVYKNKQKLVQKTELDIIVSNPDIVELDNEGLAVKTSSRTIIFYNLNYDDNYYEEYNMVDDDNAGEMWGFVQVAENMLCVSCRKNGDDYIGFYGG